MSASTQTYLLSLYVTYQQEAAIRCLFSSHDWPFRKKDGDSKEFDIDRKSYANHMDSDDELRQKTSALMDIHNRRNNKTGEKKKIEQKIVTEAGQESSLESDEALIAKVKTHKFTVDDGDDDDDLNEENVEEEVSNEYSDSETKRAGTKSEEVSNVYSDSETKRAGTNSEQYVTSKKLIIENTGKKLETKVKKMKTYSNRTVFSKLNSQKSTKDSSETRQSTEPDDSIVNKESESKFEVDSCKLELDIDPERLAIELELQETDDIDHYETVHKALRTDESFCPPSDVQELDGFSPSLGCYYCPDCGYTFQLQRWYEIHKWKGRCVYTCKVCSERFTFRNISAYRTHINSHLLELEAVDNKEPSSAVLRIQGKLVYRCLFMDCEGRFSSKSSQNRHLKGHNEALYKCCRCSSFYCSKEKLDEHNQCKHSRSVNRCEICGTGFLTGGALKRHERECHTYGQTAFPCGTCPKSFATLTRLAEHTNLHLGAKPYSCKFCQQPFTRYDSCKRHEKICLTRRHKKGLHNVQAMESCDFVNLQCLYAGCLKRFSSKFNLLRHLKGHSQNVFKCSRCTQYFQSEEDLNDHDHKKHNMFANICHQCGKGFTTSSGMKRHLRLCQVKDSDKVPCNSCSKVFPSKERMLEHLNVHLGSKPYRCKHCDKAFSRYDTCKRHEKNCQNGGVLCRFCGRTFSSKGTVADHILAVHDNIRQECDVCGEKFMYKASLNKHKKNKGHCHS